jgi:FAD/FMN-containing dehydrogenase
VLAKSTPHPDRFLPGRRVDVAPLLAALGDLAPATDRTSLERAAADYHWYSPLLSQALAGRRPQGVLRPSNEAEVLRIAAACARHRVPLTLRGGGTGNYGQCVPLAGGVVMETGALDAVLAVGPGFVRVQAGATIHAVNDAVAATGQQLRMWPSTARIATIGGFIAGGHSGIGSVRHGILADAGNVRSLRIATLEEPPRVLLLEDADIQKVHHAYGSNGIVLELELALTPRIEWLHTVVLFDRYADVLRFGLAVQARCGPGAEVDVFQLSAVEHRITPYYEGLRGRLEGADAMFAQVAPASRAAFHALARSMGGRIAFEGKEGDLLAQGLPSCTECAYNHTTLEALKSDRGVTYLQVAYPGPLDVSLVERQMAHFGDEVLFHHEFSRAGGQAVAFALPLVTYFDEAQLRAVMAHFEAGGCWNFDPHTWVLEDGGMKQVDEAQLAFKRLADPLGLMNPGKVRGWDERVLGIPGGVLPPLPGPGEAAP